MDAVEFLKTSYRMCNTYENCNACPVDTYACYIHGGNCRENPDGVVAVVEQWAKDHPIKTRQSEFLKQYPNASIIDGVLIICPMAIDKALDDSKRCYETTCHKCLEKYWLAPINESEE